MSASVQDEPRTALQRSSQAQGFPDCDRNQPLLVRAVPGAVNLDLLTGRRTRQTLNSLLEAAADPFLAQSAISATS